MRGGDPAEAAITLMLRVLTQTLVQIDRERDTNFAAALRSMPENHRHIVIKALQKNLRRALVHVTVEGGTHEHP